MSTANKLHHGYSLNIQGSFLVLIAATSCDIFFVNSISEGLVCFFNLYNAVFASFNVFEAFPMAS